MSEKLKKFLIGLCAFAIFIALFGKMIFILIFGMLWFGFYGPPVTLNERSDLILGDTWVQDDLFKLSVEQKALIVQPDTEKKLVRLNVSVENYKHYSNEKNEMACLLWVYGDDYEVEEAQALNFFYVAIGDSEQFQYQFYVPADAEWATLTTRIYTVDSNQFYRNDWKIDVRENVMETIDLRQMGSVIDRYTEELENINDILLNPTKTGDNKVICYVNDVPILQGELSFRTALGFISKYPRTDTELLEMLTEEKVLQRIAAEHNILPTEEQIAKYIRQEQQEPSLMKTAERVCASGDISMDEYWNLYERYNVIRLLTASNVFAYYAAEHNMTESEYRLQLAEWAAEANVVTCKQ